MEYSDTVSYSNYIIVEIEEEGITLILYKNRVADVIRLAASIVAERFYPGVPDDYMEQGSVSFRMAIKIAVRYLYQYSPELYQEVLKDFAEHYVKVGLISHMFNDMRLTVDLPAEEIDDFFFEFIYDPEQKGEHVALVMEIGATICYNNSLVLKADSDRWLDNSASRMMGVYDYEDFAM